MIKTPAARGPPEPVAGFSFSSIIRHQRQISTSETRKIMSDRMPGFMPRHVFLFSGHMIDHPDRRESRFPADKEEIAARSIAEKLDELGAGPDDLALCGGACGGDLLFARACLDRGMQLTLHLPFTVPVTLTESVTFAGPRWPELFYAVINHPNTSTRLMPEELGLDPSDRNPYERNNLWMLETALAWGLEKVICLCLWNGKSGDGPGGTKHLHDTVREHSGQVHVLNTTQLW